MQNINIYVLNSKFGHFLIILFLQDITFPLKVMLRIHPTNPLLVGLKSHPNCEASCARLVKVPPICIGLFTFNSSFGPCGGVKLMQAEIPQLSTFISIA